MLLHKNNKLLIIKQNEFNLYKKVIIFILFYVSSIASKHCCSLYWLSSHNNSITVNVQRISLNYLLKFFGFLLLLFRGVSKVEKKRL